MIPLIMFLFVTPFILIVFLKSRIMKKIINTHGEKKVNKTVLKIGSLLVLLGILVVIIGYLVGYTPYERYENGYHYTDEVAILALIFIWNGLPLLFWWGGNKLKKFSY